MSTEDAAPKHSAWQALIDDWVEREAQLRPHLPVRGGTVLVRDAIEVDDHAYVLLSFDIDHPWPAEEDIAGDGSPGSSNTAVIQAERVRRPWHERDSTRAITSWRSGDGRVVVHEHLVGSRRAFSGTIGGSGAERVALHLDHGDPVEATVVDGWFLAIVPEPRRALSIAVDGGEVARLERADMGSSLPDVMLGREAAGDAMYFSPLDLRSVVPVVQWERSGEIVAVATCIEQYDDGGMLRLRIDGIRADDDTFVNWPRVGLTIDGTELNSAVCGEYSLADTISLDIGFRPWLPIGARTLDVRIEGVRGAAGEIEPMTLSVRLPG